MDATPERGWIRGVPNLLSSLRVILALVFPFAPERAWLPLVVAGGATDGLDGRIARRFGVQSTFGGLLDAFADKLFVVSILATWAVQGRIAVWQVLLLLPRDIVVAYVSAYYASRRRWGAFHGMPARTAGKVTTLLLFAYFVVLLATIPTIVADVVFVCAAACSLVAGIDYAVQFRRARATD